MEFKDNQLLVFVLAIVLCSLSSLVVALRCGVRLHIKAFSWDDALMVVGQVHHYHSPVRCRC